MAWIPIAYYTEQNCKYAKLQYTLVIKIYQINLIFFYFIIETKQKYMSIKL